MGIFDRLRYWVYGIGPEEEPILIRNDLEMLTYISMQKCSCGGDFVLASDPIKPITGSVIVTKTECKNCKKRKNWLFAYTVVQVMEKTKNE